jgi:apolipoprotein N-acyltransferase
MVVGYTRTDGPAAQRKTYNSAAFIDPTHGIQGSYDKIGLVPWTEFTPLHGLTSRRASRFTHGAQCRVFELAGAAKQKTHRFAIAICYDVAFPQIFRQAMQSADGAPEFFLVCSSERSDRTGRMSRHLLNLARLRAIECRRTLVRNVNLGRSGRIDSTGRLCDETLPLLVPSATPLGQIPIDSRSTLYLLWGDWIPPVVVCVALAGVGSRLFRRRRSNSVMPARRGDTEDLSERDCFAHARLLDEITV